MLEQYFQRFTPRSDIAWLIGISAIVFFTRLGGDYHWASREIRHAEIIREMLVSGDYLIPRCMGEVYVDKPPIFHWIGAALMKLSGGPSLFAARCPLALAGLAGVLATYALGTLMLGRLAALIAAAALAGMPLYVIMARQARPDMFLMTAILLSALCFASGLRSQQRTRRNQLFLLAGIFSGIAVITKGPYGILFPAIFFGIVAHREKGVGRLVRGLPLVALGVVAPILLWAVPVYLHDGGRYLSRVVTQHDLSAFGGHRRPFYWYVGPLLLTAMPYVSFLPWTVKRWREQGSSVFLMTTAAMLVVLSLVPGKRNHYLLPLFPFLALGIAEAVARYLPTRRALERAILILIPLSWLGHLAYFGAYLPVWHREGDPEYVFARLACERMTASSQIVCQRGIEEEIAWLQRRFDNIHPVDDPSATLLKLRELGPATLLAYDKKQINSLAPLLSSGALVELVSPRTSLDKQWTLYRYGGAQ